MKQLNLFIELIRLKKPIGFMLLFWPCAWGLTLSYNFSEELYKYVFYLILFFLGSVLMRSAGCIVNDIFDRDQKCHSLYTRQISLKLSLKKIKLDRTHIYTILRRNYKIELAPKHRAKTKA